MKGNNYKKMDADTTAWDLNPSMRNFVSSTKVRRKLKKKFRKNLRRAIDKFMESCYNEGEERRCHQ